MQHTQRRQHKSTLEEGKFTHPLRRPVVPRIFNGAAQENPVLRRLRLVRPAKTYVQKHTDSSHRVLADGNTARGGENGLGVFYEAQEEAARRIAYRLHDESAQILATVYLELAGIARDCPDSTVRKIDLVVKHLDGVREQLRGMSHELSPPLLDQFGLMAALQSLADGVRNRSSVNMVVSGSVANLPRLIGTVLYRVVQEALSNVVRHAKATEAVVKLWIENNKVFCTVSDDGIGFKTWRQQQDVVIGEVYGPVHGLGLAGIHERITALKGRCQITSRRNGGMKLKVEIPL